VTILKSFATENDLSGYDFRYWRKNRLDVWNCSLKPKTTNCYSWIVLS